MALRRSKPSKAVPARAAVTHRLDSLSVIVSAQPGVTIAVPAHPKMLAFAELSSELGIRCEEILVQTLRTIPGRDSAPSSFKGDHQRRDRSHVSR